MFWWILSTLVVLVLLYVFFLRGYAREVPALFWFYEQVDWVESWLWDKSKTIFVSRLITLASVIVSVNDIVLPILTVWDVSPFIPEAYQKYVPLVGVIIGPVMEWLRRLTTQPLSVVSIAEVNMTPEVKEAIHDSNVAKAVAVEAVAEAAKAPA